MTISTSPLDTISVLIADERPVVRAGLRGILHDAPEFQIVAETSSPEETRQAIAELSPKIVLASVMICSSVPAKVVEGERMNVSMLALTQNPDARFLYRVLGFGAIGYLREDNAQEEFLGAIRRVARGEILFSAEEMIRARRWQEAEMRKWNSLTDRERQALWTLMKGLDERSWETFTSVTRASSGFSFAHILDKLEVHSRQEAFEWACEYFKT